MAARIQFKRGLGSSWTSSNPILFVGECGFETDTGKLKVGNGTTAWNSLSYFFGDISGANLNDFGDVSVATPTTGDILRWNGTSWVNDNIVTSDISDITATVSEINYIDGVTSSIQTQLNSKAPTADPTFTGTVSGVTKSMVGLGSVDNTSDSSKPVSTATQSALDLKSNIDSPSFTGVPAAPTAASTTSTTQIATTAFVQQEINALVDGAPVALNTLNELAAAINDDASYASTITTALGLKAAIDSPTFTGTVSGVTKTMVGLGSVDNTSDASKPVSTAQQTALDLKASLADPTFTGTATTNHLIVDGDFTANGTNFTVDNTGLVQAPGGFFTGNTLQLNDPIDFTMDNQTTVSKSGIVSRYQNIGSTKYSELNPYSLNIQDESDTMDVANNNRLYAQKDNLTLSSGNVSTPLAQVQVSVNGGASPFSAVGVYKKVGTGFPQVETGVQLNGEGKIYFSTTGADWLTLDPSGATDGQSIIFNNATQTFEPTTVTKAMVGLGSVDNTSDAGKPVSTATQTALDLKAPLSVTIHEKVASYTLVLTDNGKMIEMNIGSANTTTIPPNSSVAFPIGTQIAVLQTNTGQTTITAGAGVTVNATPGLKLRARWSSVTLIKRATDTWVAVGDLQA